VKWYLRFSDWWEEIWPSGPECTKTQGEIELKELEERKEKKSGESKNKYSVNVG